MSTNGAEKMKHLARLGVTLTAVAVALCCFGCPGVITVPAPCASDADCPEGIACIYPNGMDETGISDEDETSTGTPAPCNADEDCPEGIACVFANGMDQDGFCDVEETQVTVPAPCASDADCCAAVDCNAEADNTVRAGCCDPLCFRTCLDGECVTACESDE